MLFCTLGLGAFLQKKKTETHDQSGAVDAAHPSARYTIWFSEFLFFIDKYDTEEKGKAASTKAWYNKLNGFINVQIWQMIEYGFVFFTRSFLQFIKISFKSIIIPRNV